MISSFTMAGEEEVDLVSVFTLLSLHFTTQMIITTDACMVRIFLFIQ